MSLIILNEILAKKDYKISGSELKTLVLEMIENEEIFTLKGLSLVEQIQFYLRPHDDSYFESGNGLILDKFSVSKSPKWILQRVPHPQT